MGDSSEPKRLVESTVVECPDFEVKEPASEVHAERPKKRDAAKIRDRRKEVAEVVHSVDDLLVACKQVEAAEALRGAFETTNKIADKVEEVKPLAKKAWEKLGALFDGIGPRPPFMRGGNGGAK